MLSDADCPTVAMLRPVLIWHPSTKFGVLRASLFALRSAMGQRTQVPNVGSPRPVCCDGFRLDMWLIDVRASPGC